MRSSASTRRWKLFAASSPSCLAASGGSCSGEGSGRGTREGGGRAAAVAVAGRFDPDRVVRAAAVAAAAADADMPQATLSRTRAALQGTAGRAMEHRTCTDHPCHAYIDEPNPNPKSRVPTMLYAGKRGRSVHPPHVVVRLFAMVRRRVLSESVYGSVGRIESKAMASGGGEAAGPEESYGALTFLLPVRLSVRAEGEDGPGGRAVVLVPVGPSQSSRTRLCRKLRTTG